LTVPTSLNIITCDVRVSSPLLETHKNRRITQQHMKAGRWHFHRALVEVGGRGGIWGRVGTTTRWRASSTSLLYSISNDAAPSQSIRRAATAATAPATEHRGLRKDHFTVNSLLDTTLYSTCPENSIQPPLNPPPYSGECIPLVSLPNFFGIPK